MHTTYCYGVLAALLTMIGTSMGQSTESPAIDLESRKASVVNLEELIKQRETRLAELGQDIITLDARIEKRVGELVKLLASTADSQDSKTRVAKLKQEAIEGLKNGINRYVQKRRDLRERAKSGDEAALNDLGVFDERISTRVDQIVELSNSFPTYKDTKKYESDGGSYWNGYYYENSRVSDEWKQNRRNATQAKTTRDETTKAIRETLERLDQRRRMITDDLENRRPSAAARKLYEQELGQIDAYSEKLDADLRAVTLGDGAKATRKPGLDEAISLENLLDDARKDLRQDVSSLFRLYDEFDRSRAKVNGMKENLAARKAWLEENAPAEK